MNILVTGGAGFIGSNFIRYWLKKYKKDKVVNLDKLTYAGNLNNTKDFESNPNYFFVKGDIASKKVVDNVMDNVDFVVNFAAESHVDRSVVSPELVVKTNVLGTQILLQTALAKKVKKFLHVSTDEVYGHLPLNTKKKFTETTAYEPRSPYSATKAGSDHLVSAYFHTYNLHTNVTNCANNYGPFQSIEKFIPRSITTALSDEKVKLYGDGKNIRDWIHVLDHCKALELVLKNGKAGEKYVIGSVDKEITNLKLAHKILKALDKDKEMIEFVKDRPGHDKKYSIDSSKIIKDLGWKPEIEFEKGLLETVNWYRDNRWYWEKDRAKIEGFYNRSL